MTKVYSRAMVSGHVIVVPVCSFEFLFNRSCIEVYHLDGFVFGCCIKMNAITGKFQSSAGFLVVFQVHQFTIFPRGGICVSENELLIYIYQVKMFLWKVIYFKKELHFRTPNLKDDKKTHATIFG